MLPWGETHAGLPSLIQMLHEGIFFFFGSEFSTGVRAPLAVGQESVRAQPTPPAYKSSCEVARRIYLVEKTSPGAFEVTANPCNHGNFGNGSSETAGRPLSKYSWG